MTIIIYCLAGFVALAFVYSGISKTLLSEAVLVSKGQTGVSGLPNALIRFIGIAELTGVAGLLIPLVTGSHYLILTIASLCLGGIMIPASVVHARRKEYKSVGLNITLLVSCVSLAIMVMTYSRGY